MAALPYKEKSESKKQQVAEMFDNISARYDFLNHFLSAGIDILWRKRAIRKLKYHQPKQILDIATGTGDFALEALKLNPDKVTGIDISERMLEKGIEKIRKRNLQDKIELKVGDSENLPFQDNFFDAVIVSFGVRNFEDLEKGLGEMQRVLKPGGKVVILEFSKPQKFPFRQIYNFYFKAILPKIGRIFSGDSAAYTYLPESVQEFPYGNKFIEILEKTGFKNGSCYPQTLGISTIYMGEK